MKDYSEYRNVNINEKIINDGQHLFDVFVSGIEGSDIVVDNQATKGVVYTKYNNSSIKTNSLIISKDIGQIGSYVEYKNKTWILVDLFDTNNPISKKGIMSWCNNTLTFQDQDTLEIYKLPCVLTNKTSPYFDGTDKNKYFVLPAGQLSIVVPNNNYTQQLELKQRLIFNHSSNYVFEITDIDALTEPHLMTISVNKVIYDSNVDNLELNVSKYKEPTTSPTPPASEGIVIDIEGNPTLSSWNGGTYTARVFVDGAEDNTKTVAFNVKQEVANNKINIVSQDGHNCTLQSANKENFGFFTLVATLDEDNNITVEKKIELTLF